MFRVSCATGTVDVTEDHSLLDADRRLLKPLEVTPSTVLLRAPIRLQRQAQKLFGTKRAWLCGAFFSGGEARVTDSPDGIARSFEIACRDRGTAEIIRKDLVAQDGIFPDDITVTASCDSASHVVTVRGDLDRIVDRYRSLSYDTAGDKVVPLSILNGSVVVRTAFLEGAAAASAACSAAHMGTWACGSKVGAQGKTHFVLPP
jgi:hypothetical protein